MTRINVIDPKLLSDKHLGAEYRELPRVFGLVRRAIARGERPDDPRNPNSYVLGQGHVRFFYARLGFVLARYEALCQECLARGRHVGFSNRSELIYGITREWFGQWSPPQEAILLNVARIVERGGKL